MTPITLLSQAGSNIQVSFIMAPSVMCRHKNRSSLKFGAFGVYAKHIKAPKETRHT